MFGLPDGVTACLFDMDGVVTQTAVVHAAAWKEMFDDFLVRDLIELLDQEAPADKGAR